jgi:hypothetical protein
MTSNSLENDTRDGEDAATYQRSDVAEESPAYALYHETN